MKVSLEGGYKGQDGCFEWIVETNKLINQVTIHIPPFLRQGGM
jgi:hypothetical protein